MFTNLISESNLFSDIFILHLVDYFTRDPGGRRLHSASDFVISPALTSNQMTSDKSHTCDDSATSQRWGVGVEWGGWS